MKFEFEHLDVIENSPTHHEVARESTISTRSTQSLILNELQKETEELQNKLKLNHRRLLLFETENNKLIEEKNKYFFEMQNLTERNKILVEKMLYLETENNHLDSAHAELREKNEALLKINETQMLDLKRFSKFHHKIQNVIKPYISELKQNLTQCKKEVLESDKKYQDLCIKLAHLQEVMTTEINILKNKISLQEADKILTIKNYEEQIHMFSKEIYNLEQGKTDFINEINRLKKAVEFKNYFENELIKFKRIHEEDQKEVASLKDNVNELMIKTSVLSEERTEQIEKVMRLETDLHNKDNLLESTRAHLARQLEKNEQLIERLNRLEKLNLNLSQQMQLKT